jgi:hypothetical protein
MNIFVSEYVASRRAKRIGFRRRARNMLREWMCEDLGVFILTSPRSVSTVPDDAGWFWGRRDERGTEIWLLRRLYILTDWQVPFIREDVLPR